MKDNKNEYLIKTLLVQSVVCLILFGLLFAFKKSDVAFFDEVEKILSSKLEDNLSIDEIEAVFSTITSDKEKAGSVTEFKTETEPESESEYIPLEEPSLKAEIIAGGGSDLKVSSSKEIPDNVSIDDYELNQSMILPVVGKTTSEFGTRIHPISGDLRFHAGIDIAAPIGEKIYSAFDGEVIFAGYDQWNGNFLKIQHENDIMTVYCHCQKLNVKKGEKIRAGEVIAFVGSTGSSTGPHLHFELRFDDVSYNPQKALSEAINAI